MTVGQFEFVRFLILSVISYLLMLGEKEMRIDLHSASIP